MFEQFSRSYYLGRLYIEPIEAETSALSRAQYDRIVSRLYGSDEERNRSVGEVRRSEKPLVMKLCTHHLTVRGDETVPADTLGVPIDLLESTPIRNPPTLHQVLLAKANRVHQLLPIAEGSLT